MAEFSILSTPYGEVLVDPSAPYVLVQWKGSVSAEQFIAVVGRALTFAEATITPLRPWAWIADARRIRPLLPAAAEWIEQVFAPRVQALGIREISLVTESPLPERVVLPPAVPDTCNSHCRELRFRYYPSVQEAIGDACQRLLQVR